MIKHGLSPKDLLALIACLDGAIPVGTLEGSAAAATLTADKLVKLGLIRRFHSKQDRRKVFLIIKPAGIAVHKKILNA
tara:strand:+ start:4476 stop:4709 length:234 start_codon:yes stop_codon:yes gene_type:complete